MLGLTFRSDVATVDAAIGMLLHELNELPAAAKSDRDVVYRHRVDMPHQNRERKPKGYARDASAESHYSVGPWTGRPIREAGLRWQRPHEHRGVRLMGAESPSSGSAKPASNEQGQAAVGRLIACVVAAGRAAGFAVESTEN